MHKYGESIYGTRGNIMLPSDWGVVTAKDKFIYVHVLKDSMQSVLIDGIKNKIKNCEIMGTHQKVNYVQNKKGVTIYLNQDALHKVDLIVKIETK